MVGGIAVDAFLCIAGTPFSLPVSTAVGSQELGQLYISENYMGAWAGRAAP